MKKLLFILFSVSLLQACETIDLYEKIVSFPNHEWKGKDKPAFKFIIQDTAARYNIFAVLRHSQAYDFNNIWLNITTIAPGDTAVQQQVNLRLGNNAKGWLGSAMGDIIEHRIALNKFPVKLNAGEYTFILQQIMREDPLKNILNAGIRVEKVD